MTAAAAETNAALSTFQMTRTSNTLGGNGDFTFPSLLITSPVGTTGFPMGAKMIFEFPKQYVHNGGIIQSKHSVTNKGLTYSIGRFVIFQLLDTDPSIGDGSQAWTLTNMDNPLIAETGTPITIHYVFNNVRFNH